MLRAQQLAKQDARSDKGYAMMMTSIITIAMFSMLAAYMTMTNLSKSSTNAYIDGTNTFYAAESGLNRRAEQLRQRFVGYTAPKNTTATPNPANISTCFPLPLTTTPTANNDFECRNYPFKYNNNIAQTNSTDGSGATVLSEQDGGKNSVQYTSFTFVQDKTNYVGTPPAPSPQLIPAGQTYAGLNAQEYRYTVYSTAAKPDTTNPTNPVQGSDGKTVLQMDFRSRIVPLFQFAVFYEGDLEMNSSSNMTIGGLVHTNGNFYVQPNSGSNAISTTFLAPITAVGKIYNRVDSAKPWNGGIPSGISRVLLTGTICVVPTNCKTIDPYGTSVTDPSRGVADPLSALELAVFGTRVKDGAAGVKRLETPPPGFLRKRSYNTGVVGEYYAKADMRLEMVPDRDVTGTGVTPWVRNRAIIPFNFTSMTKVAGTAGTCSTTAPAVAPAATLPSLANDPAVNYIAPDRNDATLFRCNVFSKGQLQSLRQPVLVLNNPTATPALQAAEDLALGKPPVPTAGLPTLSVTLNTPTNKKIILRALQVALASTPSPITLDVLNKPFTDAAYTTAGTPGNLFLAEFTRLLNTLPPSVLLGTDVASLTTGATTFSGIANIQGAWFLPAPIQRIENNQPIVKIAANPRDSGFYDGRERKWITMLQTNIASLSVWNRDGLYVEASDNATDTLRKLPYITTNLIKNAVFNFGTIPVGNLTDGLAFDRATGAAIPSTPKGLQSFGLGSVDTTEGGLVFHASVSDDLDGDGIISAANDVSLDISAPIFKKNPDNSNFIDPNTGTTVIIDYARKYRNGANYQSPFGFAFNGGDYLPGPLTLVTDQAIYVQGDFNNNAAPQPNSAGAIRYQSTKSYSITCFPYW